MDLGENVLAAFGLIASSLIAIVANSLLLVVFCRRRGLRTISNRFVINLLFANVISSIFLLPTLIIDSTILDAPTSAIFTSDYLQSINTTSNNNNNTYIITTEEETFIENAKSDLKILENAEEVIIDDPQQILEVIESTVNYTLTFRSKFDTRQDVICFLAEFGVTFVCTACIFSVLLIGIDQYLAVLHPLRYQSYINKTRSLLLVLSTWFVSILFGAGSALTDANVNYFRACQSRQYQSVWTCVFAVAYVIVVIIVPFVTICEIYVCIYGAAHKSSARVRTVTNMSFPTQPTTGLKKTHSAPNFSQYQTPSTASLPADPDLDLKDPLHLLRSKLLISRTSSDRLTVTEKNAIGRKQLLSSSRSLFGHLRHKLSNASVFRYREESRTAKISLLVIFMVLLCYGPYGVSLVLNSVKVGGTTTLYRLNTLSLVLLISSNVISPFLFAYRNRRIQRELAKFLHIIPQSSLRKHQYKSSQNKLSRSHLPNIVIQRHSNSEAVLGSSINGVHEDGTVGESDRRSNHDMVRCDVAEPFLLETGEGSPSMNGEVQGQLQGQLQGQPQGQQKKSILKRVCSGKNWTYKKCSFIAVPDSCLDARGSFSSASTQVSTEDCC